jgi:hypothetical protein
MRWSLDASIGFSKSARIFYFPDERISNLKAFQYRLEVPITVLVQSGELYTVVAKCSSIRNLTCCLLLGMRENLVTSKFPYDTHQAFDWPRHMPGSQK